MYNSLHDLLQEIFAFNESKNLFWATENRLSLPRPHTNYMRKPLRYSMAINWYNLPSSLRMANSLSTFKKGADIIH